MRGHPLRDVRHREVRHEPATFGGDVFAQAADGGTRSSSRCSRGRGPRPSAGRSSPTCRSRSRCRSAARSSTRPSRSSGTPAIRSSHGEHALGPAAAGLDRDDVAQLRGASTRTASEAARGSPRPRGSRPTPRSDRRGTGPAPGPRSCRSRSGVAPRSSDRDVGHVELGPVAHHEHDPVAPADAQAPEARGEAGGPLGVVGPGPVPPGVAVLPAQRDAVRAVRGRSRRTASGRSGP